MAAEVGASETNTNTNEWEAVAVAEAVAEAATTTTRIRILILIIIIWAVIAGPLVRLNPRLPFRLKFVIPAATTTTTTVPYKRLSRCGSTVFPTSPATVQRLSRRTSTTHPQPLSACYSSPFRRSGIDCPGIRDRVGQRLISTTSSSSSWKPASHARPWTLKRFGPRVGLQ